MSFDYFNDNLDEFGKHCDGFNSRWIWVDDQKYFEDVILVKNWNPFAMPLFIHLNYKNMSNYFLFMVFLMSFLKTRC